MLFVIGAMAALSIDVVTIYTARSEAQLAADAAALAGARVLANSGATSDTSGLSMANAWDRAKQVALQVAEQNKVGGMNLSAADITLPASPGGSNTNPTVKVTVQKNNLPTFFARIWGTRQVTVGATATAEAYNASGAGAAVGTAAPPPTIALTCVKPWLLPNMDPRDASGGTTIFDPTTGALTDSPSTLLGHTTAGPPSRLQARCSDCSVTPVPSPSPWQYYPGDPTTTFPPPTQALPSCTPALTTAYQKSIAGCIETPIACNSNANFDTANYPSRNAETRDPVNCLTHAINNKGDEVDPASTTPPFQFLAGDDNPVVGAAGNDVILSDSLVTVPVFNSTKGTAPSNPVTIIGFVQLFLSFRGRASPANGFVRTEVINVVGCGTAATGQPILGNGSSPVAVRLISQ